MSLQQLYLTLLIGGLVLLASIVGTRVASGVGFPSMLLFLLIGVAVGGDGLGPIVRHIKHIVDVAGEDTPALGSDWDGFIVPTGTRGFSANTIHHKLSLRASITSELVLDDVRLPDDALLPEVKGLKGPLSCLSEARYGIIWGSMGAARSAANRRS